MPGIMKVGYVRFIPKSIPGKDGVSIQVTPDNVLLKRNGATQRVNVYVDMFSGAAPLPYGSGEGQFTCGMLTEQLNGSIATGLTWGFSVDADGRFFYRLTYNGLSSIVNLEVPFTVTYDGNTYHMSFRVNTVADGAAGYRGPVFRGPLDWEAVVNGFSFEAGGKDDTYMDSVYYKKKYYACSTNHQKTADNFPGSDADKANGYWVTTDPVPILISKILFAQYELVEYLGAECIEMYERDANGDYVLDAQGNKKVIFRAAGGNVTCNVGTFNNIVVKNAQVAGAITAESLSLKLSTKSSGVPDGSMCYNCSFVTLPEIPEGMTRIIRVINPRNTRAAPDDLRLTPATSNVFISSGFDTLSINHAQSAAVTLDQAGENAGVDIELIGRRGIWADDYQKTVWIVNKTAIAE